MIPFVFNNLDSIPNSVYIIGKEAFRNCTKLSKVYLGTDMASIGADAFNYCSKLSIVVCMATTPPSINSNTFDNTNASFKVYVPDESIEMYILYNVIHYLVHIGWVQC